VKSERNSEEVKEILLKISNSAKSQNGNLLELTIQAAKARATLGEISSALEEEFGRYKATVRTISGVYSNEIMQDQKYIKALSLAKKFESIAGRRPRIMVSKMGQDGHDRGAKVVATSFADIGFDVDIGPLFQTAKEVAKSAVENDVHIIGVSSLAAGHLTLVPELLKELKLLKREDIMIIIGGVIPKNDYDVLFKMGVAAVFGPGTIIAEAAQEIIQIMINGFIKDEF
jgi:methylmalonyl-CoA mutase